MIRIQISGFGGVERNVAYIFQTSGGDWRAATRDGTPHALSNFTADEMLLRFALQDAGDDPDKALAAVERFCGHYKPRLVTASDFSGS